MKFLLHHSHRLLQAGSAALIRVKLSLGHFLNWREPLSILVLICAYLLLIWRGSEKMGGSFIILELIIGLLLALVIARQIRSARENSRLNRSLNFTLDQLSIKSSQVEETAKRLQVEIVAHQQAKDRLSYETLHDSLTGLPNRALFLDRLTWAAQFIKRHEGSVFALLYLNFDHFKAVNDSMGHTAGDQLLVEASNRLVEQFRNGSFKRLNA